MTSTDPRDQIPTSELDPWTRSSVRRRLANDVRTSDVASVRLHGSNKSPGAHSRDLEGRSYRPASELAADLRTGR